MLPKKATSWSDGYNDGYAHGIDLSRGLSNGQLAGNAARKREEQEQLDRLKRSMEHACRRPHDQPLRVASIPANTAHDVPPVPLNLSSDPGTLGLWPGLLDCDWWAETPLFDACGRLGEGLRRTGLPLRFFSALIVAVAFWIASLTWPWAVLHVRALLPATHTSVYVLGLGAIAGLFLPSVAGWIILIIRGVLSFALAWTLRLAVVGMAGAVIWYGIRWLMVRHQRSLLTYRRITGMTDISGRVS